MATESEQLIKDIEDMKVKGAYLITKVALEALGMRARELAARGEAPAPALRAAAARLAASQPSMACVANGCAAGGVLPARGPGPHPNSNEVIP